MIVDQPPPMHQPDRRAVWDLVIVDMQRAFAQAPAMSEVVADMAERDRIGRERYGTPLTTHNGRDHLVDCYQEMLDAAVYLRAEIEERGANYVIIGTHALYLRQLENIIGLRAIIRARDRSVVSG